jgi:ABC-2 type transport system ATP-binding protein
MEQILSIDNIHKYYGRIKAVNGISCEVKKGEVLGILGPNGSGKTTLLSVITDIIKAQQGDYNWFGGETPHHARKKIGALIETPNFYPYMNLHANLEIVAQIKNADPKDIDRVLKITGLLERKNSRFATLSLGMKQRLALASVLLGDPEVLVLDEPTNGLDPEGIAEVREIIKAEAIKGKTIIMASHILDEVEKVCSHVLVLKEGKKIGSGKVNELLGKNDLVYLASSNLDELQAAFMNCPHVSNLKRDLRLLVTELKDGASIEDINKFAWENNIILNHLELKKESLESQFLEMVQ